MRETQRERTHQTHRSSSWLHALIYDLAWPSYECELCVGQEYWRGCECAYRGDVAPGVGPTRRHLFWRWVWSKRA